MDADPDTLLDETPPDDAPAQTAAGARTFSRQFAAIVRWLHIYVSLLAFSALVFFGVTGITLNHPDWFGIDAQQMVEHRGTLRREWLEPAAATTATGIADAEPGARPVAKLEIVEWLRAAHGVRGAVVEFRTDDSECLVLFKGAAYAADAVIDRTTGEYTVTVTTMGAVALINDLHKGRDTGRAWSIVIDVVSLVTVFTSVTGLVLIFYLRRKRLTGLLTALAGTLILLAIAAWLVP